MTRMPLKSGEVVEVVITKVLPLGALVETGSGMPRLVRGAVGDVGASVRVKVVETDDVEQRFSAPSPECAPRRREQRVRLDLAPDRERDHRRGHDGRDRPGRARATGLDGEDRCPVVWPAGTTWTASGPRS